MSNAGKRWMMKVAQVPCVICRHMGLGETPAQVHHLKYQTGASDRASDFLVAALCPEHHTGAAGIHTLKEHGFYARYKLSELDALALTLEAIAK